ncbi:MAG: ABC transporter substrate-binding protein, partial [Pseudomonadota bacterium]|nr:ABC transporter substrate-binding protein [Pseudomonadota bacterium]
MNNTRTKIALALVAATTLSTSYADELLVGVELPLTGSLARVGNGIQEGIKVAVELFNKTNGKHTVKLIIVDDESAPAKAIAAVEKLASQNVLAVTGGYGSNNIAPASDAADKLGLAYVSSGGVDDSLVNSGRKNFFRINNTAGYQKALVGLVSDLNARSVSIIYSTKEATHALA